MTAKTNAFTLQVARILSDKTGEIAWTHPAIVAGLSLWVGASGDAEATADSLLDNDCLTWESVARMSDITTEAEVTEWSNAQ